MVCFPVPILQLFNDSFKARLTSVIVRGVFLEVASLGKVLGWSSRGFPPALVAGDHRALKAGAGHRRSVILFDVAWCATSPSLEEEGCLQQQPKC